jgi:hypothetical protein
MSAHVPADSINKSMTRKEKYFDLIQKEFEDNCIVFRRDQGSAVSMNEDEHENLVRREKFEEMTRRLLCACGLRQWICHLMLKQR